MMQKVICLAGSLVEEMMKNKQINLSHRPQSSSQSSNLPKRKVHSQWDCSPGLSRLLLIKDTLLKASNLRELAVLKVQICQQEKAVKPDRLRLNNLHKVNRNLRLKELDKGAKTKRKLKVKDNKVSLLPNKIHRHRQLLR